MATKPNVDWDELGGCASLRELFRYEKQGRTRAYSLRVITEEEYEVWVVSKSRGKATKSRKLATLENPGDAGPFLQDIERELRAGGWAAR